MDTQAVGHDHRNVSFIEALTLFFMNYFQFNGRSSRGAYWWYVLAAILAGMGTGILDMALFSQLVEAGVSPINTLLSLALLIPGISLGVRRLHDVGRSGWWILIALTIIGILLLLFWAVQPGQRMANKFGEDHEAGR
jgi:uncharacterized membrane protein YhaH (DUF805 family)